MKPLTLLLCLLLLLGCEKRVADPEIELVRAWLQSDAPHRSAAEALKLHLPDISIESLSPLETWVPLRWSNADSERSADELIIVPIIARFENDSGGVLFDAWGSGIESFKIDDATRLTPNEFEMISDTIEPDFFVLKMREQSTRVER